MARQDKLNDAWCKYMGKCSTEIMQALSFALRWCDEHPNWMSVENELPCENDIVIIANKRGGVSIGCYTDDDEWWSTMLDDEEPPIPITHWMPLPQLPKKEDKSMVS